MFRKFIYLSFLILLLTSCTGQQEDPHLVASYPSEKQIAVYPISPPETVIVYNATIELKVANVDTAAKKSEQLAYQYGGYLASSQSWFQEDEKYTTLVLAVPVNSFETAHQSLLRLGSLVSEHITGETLLQAETWQAHSHITVILQPKKSIWPTIPWPGWRPARTFAKAWDVFISIFGFLVDIVIWIGVVAGPFVVMIWGTIKIIRWTRDKSNK